ncbi:ABC transporter ATP-binding protein [Dactylosporangium sp. CA-092794]|uniref:ABC transporter ATP-binding protein n=1 Tax=Dactylosporangium sp. CA-092794 TaxID=3239929 RepID=UPI003D9072D0
MTRTAKSSGSFVLVRDLVKEYRLPRTGWRAARPTIRAVDGIDLDLGAGETLGLVGESGSGKSTVARLLVGLVEPTSGQVRMHGHDLMHLRGGELRAHRRNVQMVFQDPYSSFDPTARLVDSIAEPLRTHLGSSKPEQDARVADLLRLVGLDAGYRYRYPNQLSGGQLQRAAIARALAIEPDLVVLDEPVSALDVSTQAQVINLLRDLQARLSTSYLFIAHDLSVVEHVSHRVGVMYLGRIVESGPTEEVYERPVHPYTSALLDAVPVPDPVVQRRRRRLKLAGDTAGGTRPSGCRFRNRCPFAMAICAEVDPAPYVTQAGVTVRCHLHEHGPKLAGRSVRTLTGTGTASS